MSPHNPIKSIADYHTLYDQSIQQPDIFWAGQARKYLSWSADFTAIQKGSFHAGDVRWFEGGELNICYNCVDRHLSEKADQAALIWEGNEPGETRVITYAELHEKICRFASVLKKFGIRKGDRVCIYLPMVPEMVVAMLACARIGAVHSVVFAGFSAEALRSRVQDAGCKLLITASEGLRGTRRIALKKNVDEALQQCPECTTVIVLQRTDTKVALQPGRDHGWDEAAAGVTAECPCEPMAATDPLFILYTSGSTGKPKGILHATAGWMLHVAMSFETVFGWAPGMTHWCTADAGWITGHAYTIYGPLCHGATTVIFEGVPDYPTPARCWEIIDRHQVNIFYTAPTAIRALRRAGDHHVTQTSRRSLSVLGTVGEPINPDVWQWYHDVVGESRCSVVDTWWQTETGGIMITSFAGATPSKPGSAGWPFFGVQPVVVDEQGNAVPDGQSGRLVIRQPWPGMMQTVFNDPERFAKTYFQEVPGSYLTGDNARRDSEGYFTITGRNDDVLKISGHRIGTGEVENAIIAVPEVAEAGVVAVPDDIRGEAIYVFAALKENIAPDADLSAKIVQSVRTRIGAIATPQYIQWAEALPKTRSGKIMRRLLRKIANNECEDVGDVSTLAEPEVVQRLIEGRKSVQPLRQLTGAKNQENHRGTE